MEARAGLEPANDDFADRSLNHLGTAPNKTSSQEYPFGLSFDVTMPCKGASSQALCIQYGGLVCFGGAGDRGVRQSTTMGRGPEDAPLGATPMLPPPGGVAADRATRVFARYMDELRTTAVPDISECSSAVADISECSSPAQTKNPELPRSGPFGGGRRYDLALEKVGLLSNEKETRAAGPVTTAVAVSLAQEAETTRAADLSSAPVSLTSKGAAVRPPPGAPVVRPSVAAPSAVDVVPQELLQTTADSALLTNNPDGTVEFDIAFSDELFDEMACKVSIAKDGRVVATFRVHDVNLRRLLEAESGRLRVGLEARGLKVAEIRVEIQ